MNPILCTAAVKRKYQKEDPKYFYRIFIYKINCSNGWVIASIRSIIILL